MIFEAQSQLNKQQQAEHGGAVRGTDAARVQVPLIFGHPHENAHAHARTLVQRVRIQHSMLKSVAIAPINHDSRHDRAPHGVDFSFLLKTVAECLVCRFHDPNHSTLPAVVTCVEVMVLQNPAAHAKHQ